MTTSQIITAITSIVALAVAVYGAVLSTVTYLRDRVKVKLVVLSEYVTFLPREDRRFLGTKVIQLRVINTGRRPVTITSVGAIGLYPNNNFTDVDYGPPREITEGKFIDGFLNQDRIHLSLIDYWAASDSYGTVHKLREAPLLKHWKSKFLRIDCW